MPFPLTRLQRTDRIRVDHFNDNYDIIEDEVDKRLMADIDSYGEAILPLDEVNDKIIIFQPGWVGSTPRSINVEDFLDHVKMKKFQITLNAWVPMTGLYSNLFSQDVNHNLDTRDLIIKGLNLANEYVELTYEVIDNDNIRVMSRDNQQVDLTVMLI